MKHNLISQKKAILEVGIRMYARGYVASNDGNISVRLDEKRILITPSGVSKGFLKASDLIVVNMDGRVVTGKNKPSSEVFMHLQIYKERADVSGICHAHPPYATGFAVAGIPLDQYVLPEVIVALGTIPLVPYGTAGTEELYRSLQPFLQGYDAFLLANHGALTVGKDIFSAYYKMETLEHFAHIIFIAQHLGKVVTLNDEQVQKLVAQRENFGIRKNIGATTGNNNP